MKYSGASCLGPRQSVARPRLSEYVVQDSPSGHAQASLILYEKVSMSDFL